MDTKEFIKKANQVHGNKFNYSKVEYHRSSTKVTITCREHGEFIQRAANHLMGIGCPDCGAESSHASQRLTQEEFIAQARQVHSEKYDYSKAKYKTSLKKIIVICKDHGEFDQRAGHHLRGSGCPLCGVESSHASQRLTQEEFIAQARQVHSEKYDYSKAKYKTIHENVIIICKEHGEFLQQPANHLQGATCLKCASQARGLAQVMSTKDFIKKANQVHGNKFNYSKVEYHRSSTKVTITCREHGEFQQGPASHLTGQGCPDCRLEVMGLGDTLHNLIAQKRFIEGFLYVLEVFNDDEHFFKIGITSGNSVARRFHAKASMPYQYEILLEAPIGLIKAFQIEQDILETLSNYKYDPKIYFGGVTECLSINPIDHDEILNEVAKDYQD